MELIGLDDFLLSDVGIPPATLTNESRYLGFGVQRRDGIRGSAFFGGTAEPARWHFVIKPPTTAASDILQGLLAVPRDQPLRLLVQRDRYGDELVTAEAAVTELQVINDRDLEVAFEANDSVWLAEDIATFSKVVTTPLDHRLHLDVPGNVPTTGVYRLTPQAQRTARTANVGWSYRQRWRVTNNSDAPLFRYPVRITLGDTTPLTTTKAMANGNDVRVWLDGLEQPRTLDDWDTSSSHVWVIIPACPANGGSVTFDVVYGNPDAGSPPELAYPDLPAFRLADSTNALWYYRTNPANVATYPSQGLWYLSADGSLVDMGVPGAWRTALTFDNPLNTDTVYAAKFSLVSSQRYARATAIRASNYPGYDAMEANDTADRLEPHDGAVFYHPLGVVKINSAFEIWHAGYHKTMQEVTTTVGDTSTTETVEVSEVITDPFATFVIIYRDSASRIWNRAFARSVITGFMVEDVAAADYTTNSAKHVAIAMWPKRELLEGESTLAQFTSDSDTQVTIDTTNLVIEQVEAETEIYELATELRLGGGANGEAPYWSLLVGNARDESGAGVPRAALALDQGLLIDAEARTHTVWDGAFNLEEEGLSTHAVRAMVAHNENGEAVEYRESLWLPLVPAWTLVANGDFAVDIGSWEAGNVTTDMTATRTHDDAIGGAQVGSLKVTIDPNTAGSGARAETIASRYYRTQGREQVEVAGWVRTSHANIRPLLQILWYQDDADTPVAADTEDAWTPTVDTGYGRVFAARVPPGVTRYRICCLVKTAASSATGDAWFDDITLNDRDLYVADVSVGELAVDALIRGRYS